MDSHHPMECCRETDHGCDPFVVNIPCAARHNHNFRSTSRAPSIIQRRMPNARSTDTGKMTGGRNSEYRSPDNASSESFKHSIIGLRAHILYGVMKRETAYMETIFDLDHSFGSGRGAVRLADAKWHTDL